jgi:membrane-associated phospholipid phosphatase
VRLSSCLLLVGSVAAAAPPSFDSAPPSDLDAGRAWALAGGDAPFDDGRRTLGAFPKNLGRSFVSVLSRDNLAPFALAGAMTFASHGLDQQAARMVEGRCFACGRTGGTLGGGAAMLPAVGLVFAAGRFAPPSSTFRAASYDAAQALVVNGAWTGLLKYSLQRTRPDGLDALSLPSGHASTAFALATVTRKHYGAKAGFVAYGIAAGIGLSRIESSRHHLSDVVAGAALGTIVGRTVTRVNGEPRPRRGTWAVGPATDAHGSGLGLGVAASW